MAWARKLETTRPSAGRSPGPYVLKMRTILMSTPIGAVVRHRDRLGEALRLVVDRPGTDRVDVAPVALGLRVHERVAVDLAGRREQEPRAASARARSSVWRVPAEPTSSVSSGRARYSGGLAGLAKCSTASTGPSHRVEWPGHVVLDEA